MISYELAKKLKDAGFPQHKCFDATCNKAHPERPTLEELIEACGDDILGLNRTHADDGKPNGWVADTHTHQCDCNKKNCNGFTFEHESGVTPQEAVARLWLHLNKKI